MVISDRFAFDENMVLNKMITEDMSDTFKAEGIRDA